VISSHFVGLRKLSGRELIQHREASHSGTGKRVRGRYYGGCSGPVRRLIRPRRVRRTRNLLKSTDWMRSAPKLFTHPRKLLKSKQMRPPSERTKRHKSLMRKMIRQDYSHIVTHSDC
jgi:hypothetical protein